MSDPFREDVFLEWLRERFGADERLGVPIGDDAAVLGPDLPGATVLALDSVALGTHDLDGPEAPERLARKAVRSNLSDLAAMGARPEALLLSLGLPRRAEDALARRVVVEVEAECRRWGLCFAGGDTLVHDGPLHLGVAMTGRLIAKALRRGGARPGDLVVATGAFGGSILGRHVDFEPRLAESELLVELGPPSAAIDVSDGLAKDLHRLLRASGVGAEIDAGAVPLSAAAEALAETSGRSPLDHALGDGEDFELLVTLDPVALERVRSGWKTDTPLAVLGRTTAAAEVVLVEGGRRRALERRGYEHGSSA